MPRSCPPSELQWHCIWLEDSACKHEVRQNRWFSASDVATTEAKFLDVILYSAEQVTLDWLKKPWTCFRISTERWVKSCCRI